MALRSGLAGQIGFAEETTYGTYVAPTRFLEFNNEAIATDVARIDSTGIGTGRFLRTGRHKEYVRAAGGSVEFDYQTKGFGLLLKHCLGGYTNSLVTGSERSAVIEPDADALFGKYLTVQVGRPDVGGTVRPFSFLGGKVIEWEIKCDLDVPLKLMLNLDFKSVVTSESLATATYPTGSEILVFSEGALTINGSPVRAKSLSIKGVNGLATDRRMIGNTKLEPLGAALFSITGELGDSEFEDLAVYNAFIAGTEISNLVATFTGPTNIAGGGPPKLIVTIPRIVYEGATPVIEGHGILKQPLTFRGLYNGTNLPIKFEQRTEDTAA
jgi:hypothetical protein